MSGTGALHCDLEGQRSTLACKLQIAAVDLIMLTLVMLVQLCELGPMKENKTVNTCIL